MNEPVAYVNNMCNDSIDWKVRPGFDFRISPADGNGTSDRAGCRAIQFGKWSFCGGLTGDGAACSRADSASQFAGSNQWRFSRWKCRPSN